MKSFPSQAPLDCWLIRPIRGLPISTSPRCKPRHALSGCKSSSSPPATMTRSTRHSRRWYSGALGLPVTLAPGRRGGVGGSDYGDLSLNQVCSQRRKSVMLVIRPSVFNRYILAFDKRGLVQAPVKCGHGLPGVTGRFALEESNHQQLARLRTRHERPRRRWKAFRGPAASISFSRIPHSAWSAPTMVISPRPGVSCSVSSSMRKAFVNERCRGGWFAKASL